MDERRKFMRFNVLLEAVCRSNGVLKKITVNNFSRGGLGVLCQESINTGENVEMEVMLPGDNIPVLAEGAVTWTSYPKPGESKYRGGIRINKISNPDRNRMLEFIYHKWLMPANSKTQ